MRGVISPLSHTLLTVSLLHTVPRSVLTKVVHTLLILPNTHPHFTLPHFTTLLTLIKMAVYIVSSWLLRLSHVSQNIILALVYKDPQYGLPLLQDTKVDIHKSNR